VERVGAILSAGGKNARGELGNQARYALYMTQRKLALLVSLAPLLLFGAAQLVPYGRDHTNPPIVSEPAWDSPQTRALAKTACFDCHSNEVVWPWYMSVVPLSWLAVRDVEEGRDELNFSDWPPKEADEVVEKVLDRDMPPLQYTLIHPESRLSDADLQALAEGLRRTIAR
jgi:hypothetical protein